MADLKQIRWTVEAAANEFDIDRKTLSKRIKSGGIVPGEDGRFSTMDICRAKFSDLKEAQIELVHEQADLTKVKKEKLAGTLVNREQVQQLWDSHIIALRQKISDSDLPEKTKQDLVKDLQEIPVEDYVSKDSTQNEDSE